MTEASGRWWRDRVPSCLREGFRSVGGRSLAAATIWNGAGTVVSRGAQILAMVVAARILGAPKFGALGILLSTLAAVQTFAGLALGGTMTKYISQYRPGDPRRAGRVLAVGLVLAVGSGSLFALGVGLLAPIVSIDVMRDEALIPLLRVLSLAVLFTSLFEAETGAMAGLHAFRGIALANFASGAVTLPVVVFGAIAGGLKGVVWAFVVSGVFSCVAMGVMLRAQLRREGMRVEFVMMWRELPLLWRFALPSLLVGAASMPVSWICQSLLLRRSGYTEVALFTAANQWYGIVAFLPSIFGVVVLPRLAESHGMGNQTQVHRLSKVAMGVNASLAAVVGAVFVVLAPLLMRAYGNDFSRGVFVMDVVVVTACVTVVQAAMGQSLAAVDRMWGVAIANLAWAGSFILATWVLVDRGAIGLAMARLGSQLVCFIVVVWLYKRHVATRTAAP